MGYSTARRNLPRTGKILATAKNHVLGDPTQKHEPGEPYLKYYLADHFVAVKPLDKTRDISSRTNARSLVQSPL
jgi:hypothetical protein